MAAIRGLSLKAVKEISIKFDPFASFSVTAREFLRIISSNSMKTSNPKCKIKNQVLNDRSPSMIEVTLSNKEQFAYVIDKKINCKDLLADFNTRCKQV